MLSMSAQLISKICQGCLIGSNPQLSVYSTDSRQIKTGALFVALVGKHFDGHAFVTQVQQKGASALLVNHCVKSTLPQIVVENTIVALGKIAAWQRGQFTGPVVAITGSNGKTSVKEMLSTILSGHYRRVLSTHENLNNDIGLPLTLLRLDSQTEAMVLELGASHPGEIAYTAAICRPHIALINNVGDAHIEGFGNREEIARAKSEIFSAFDGPGTAVFEEDSSYAWLFLQRINGKARRLTFGLGSSASLHASELAKKPDGCYDFELLYQDKTAPVKLEVPGKHNVKNACASALIALQMGVTLDTCARQLCVFRGVIGRLKRIKLDGYTTLFDDTYNANPSSFKVALDVLCGTPDKKILIAGDMAELGDSALEAHRRLGQACFDQEIELYATGSLVAESARFAGVRGHYFDDQQELVSSLMKQLAIYQQKQKRCCILVKGSRLNQMERFVKTLIKLKKVHTC